MTQEKRALTGSNPGTYPDQRHSASCISSSDPRNPDRDRSTRWHPCCQPRQQPSSYRIHMDIVEAAGRQKKSDLAVFMAIQDDMDNQMVGMVWAFNWEIREQRANASGGATYWANFFSDFSQEERLSSCWEAMVEEGRHRQEEREVEVSELETAVLALWIYRHLLVLTRLKRHIYSSNIPDIRCIIPKSR